MNSKPSFIGYEALREMAYDLLFLQHPELEEDSSDLSLRHSCMTHFEKGLRNLRDNPPLVKNQEEMNRELQKIVDKATKIIPDPSKS